MCAARPVSLKMNGGCVRENKDVLSYRGTLSNCGKCNRDRVLQSTVHGPVLSLGPIIPQRAFSPPVQDSVWGQKLHFVVISFPSETQLFVEP